MKNNKAYLAGGCFWCIDAAFRMVRGVERVASGYTGGTLENPTYEQVCSETTGHAEAVEIEFDQSVITYKQILEIFFSLHDPTTLNRQGNDVGSQYRSAIFYLDEDQKKVAEDLLKEVNNIWDGKVVTELKELTKFYPAEDYHQDYFNKNPGNGYCQIVINTKLDKFKKTYSKFLKLNK